MIRLLVTIFGLISILIISGCAGERRREHDIQETMDFTSPQVHYEGLYQAKSGDAWSYLKFYADGTVVIEMSEANGNPYEASKWVHKGSEAVNEMPYKISGSNIEFSGKTSVAHFYASGTIQGNTIDIAWRVEGYPASKGTFRFRPVQ